MPILDSTNGFLAIVVTNYVKIDAKSFLVLIFLIFDKYFVHGCNNEPLNMEATSIVLSSSNYRIFQTR